MKKRFLLIPAMMLVAAVFLYLNKSGIANTAQEQSKPAAYVSAAAYTAEEETYVSFSEAGLTASPTQFGDSQQNYMAPYRHDISSYAAEGSVQHSTASEYYVRVNYEANTVTVYIKDRYGQFKTPVRAMICSTGEDTPHRGIYRPTAKAEWGYLFGGVFGQYTTTIVGDILFHSVPYTEFENPASLEWEEFDKLGTAASLGCIRLQVFDAKWIYENAGRIVAVEFYASPDPGPLGKPEAMTISGYEELRDWDPTDINPENPWLNSIYSVDK